MLASTFHRPLGKTGIDVPPLVFGTSCLGNLYGVVSAETKLEIVTQIVQQCPRPIVFDSAGKYGAGMALESLGSSLRALGVSNGDVIISNKLGWYRVPLITDKPRFERDVWFGIGHDAEARISYEGILQCEQQGRELLGPGYAPTLVSVHDPDEYLAGARDPAEHRQRFDNVVGAYAALAELKAAGRVRAVGIGAKNWRVIREIAAVVDLDWVMFACSLTVYSHPPELLTFIDDLQGRGVGIVNSAVFHGGFLTGGKWFDYRIPDPRQEAELFHWRETFFAVCRRFAVEPAAVCVQFGLAYPGIAAVSLNTENPARIARNIRLASTEIPPAVWRALQHENLISRAFPLVA